MALNLPQYPETLIESELFGHRKGAFTDAVEDYEGVFDRCSPFGAIFLDEIGEVVEPIQIKLLQVIQERIFNRVGDHRARSFRGRVIAATFTIGPYFQQTLKAKALVAGYCLMLHRRHKTIEAVARVTDLDRRTAKKHIEEGKRLFAADN